MENVLNCNAKFVNSYCCFPSQLPAPLKIAPWSDGFLFEGKLYNFTTLLHLLILMKAFYRETKVGFVLELHQILLHTAAIFVPRGDEKFKFEIRMSPEFNRNRKLIRYKSTNSEKFRRIKNRKTGISKLEKGWGKVILKK